MLNLYLHFITVMWDRCQNSLFPLNQQSPLTKETVTEVSAKADNHKYLNNLTN